LLVLYYELVLGDIFNIWLVEHIFITARFMGTCSEMVMKTMG